jgi:hypothetical protein
MLDKSNVIEFTVIKTFGDLFTVPLPPRHDRTPQIWRQ